MDLIEYQYNRGILLLNKNSFKVILVSGFLIIYNKLSVSPEGILVEGLEISNIISQLEGILLGDEVALSSRVNEIVTKAPQIKVRFNQNTKYIEFLPI